MKKLDVFLQKWRYRAVSPYVPSNSRVLDIGCFDGSLFFRFKDRNISGTGVDTHVVRGNELPAGVDLVEGRFPAALEGRGQYDVITILAVIEHVPSADIGVWVNACSELLASDGRIIITAPNPLVDKILDLLLWLKLADGMALEEHHGFDPKAIPVAFGNSFTVEREKRFQFGLNNLFVLKKHIPTESMDE